MRRRRRLLGSSAGLAALFGVVVLLAGFTITAATCIPPPTTTTTTETTMGTVPPMRPIPDPLYGVTYEIQSGASASKIAKGKAALQGLATPHLPFLRIVFDEGEAPPQYDAAINGYRPYAYLLGELLDSSSLAQISVAAYAQRTRDYLARFGEKLDVWEIGNEIGGKWAGSNVSQADKIAAAFDEVKLRGKKSALTLWYNIGCEDGAELTPLEFTDQFVPQRMKDGLDYLLVSYYEVPCMQQNGVRITEATARTLFQQLHARYPNAKLGFGEIGLEKAITAANKAQGLSILNHYYGLDLSDLAYYVGGQFWWYGWQDIATDWPDIMGTELKAGMAAMAAAIG